MITLQEYLNQKYPTLQDKETLQILNLEKISQEREQEGQTELLEGGELDLTEFKNLEGIEVYRQFLKTPITKLNVNGLTNLKTLIWPDQEGDSEEEKKLWTELGIADLSTLNNQKRKVVKEVNRLADLKGVKVNFGSEKKDDEIPLNLDHKDKAGNFCPSLVFWTLVQELASISISGDKKDKTPEFWSKFEAELEWVKNNLIENYQKEFEPLLIPSTFPTEKLEIKELLTVYYPNSENIADSRESKITIDKEIADKTWQTIQKEVLELTSQELSKNPDEEELKKLATKALINNQNGYEIIIQYHQQNPFKEKIEQLITTTPLQSEIEHSKQIIEELKKEKEQLPTPENFDKLTKQNQAWEKALLDSGITEEEFKKIKEEVDKIS